MKLDGFCQQYHRLDSLFFYIFLPYPNSIGSISNNSIKLNYV